MSKVVTTPRANSSMCQATPQQDPSEEVIMSLRQTEYSKGNAMRLLFADGVVGRRGFTSPRKCRPESSCLLREHARIKTMRGHRPCAATAILS